jgi:hypothetical protein
MNKEAYDESKLGQLIDGGALLINRQLRVADNVDKEDMRDFELNLLFNLGGHAMNLPENKTIDNSASRRPSNVLDFIQKEL